ncbi:MAG: VanZ family protein [Candidatus Saccharibacteria bacterium]
MKIKSLSRIVLGLYLLVLLWLVLFKFSADPLSVLAHYQTRSLNLVPFAGAYRGHLNEMSYNVIAFVPLGLLLAINIKRLNFWRMLAYICTFSVAIEIAQFVFAIGRTDVTDVITNTLGGFIGLGLYRIGQRYIDGEKLDRCIVVTTLVLSTLLLLLRVFVFRVRY